MENHFNELLTATVSHEMRTPLNSMISLLMSIKKYIKDTKGLELFNIIQSSSIMLQYLVNDLLDLYQIKNGKFKKNEENSEIRKELLIV